MVGGCCVCLDERGWDENPLVYCDGNGCNVAVHQGMYFILSVQKLVMNESVVLLGTQCPVLQQ